jgi:hypothetical protein
MVSSYKKPSRKGHFEIGLGGGGHFLLSSSLAPFLRSFIRFGSLPLPAQLRSVLSSNTEFTSLSFRWHNFEHTAAIVGEKQVSTETALIAALPTVTNSILLYGPNM